MTKTSTKTCDHCGTPAKRRYAVRITKRGHTKVAMVGSSCAKRFPRANQSDLIRSLKDDKSTPTIQEWKETRVWHERKSTKEGICLEAYRESGLSEREAFYHCLEATRYAQKKPPMRLPNMKFKATVIGDSGSINVWLEAPSVEKACADARRAFRVSRSESIRISHVAYEKMLERLSLMSSQQSLASVEDVIRMQTLVSSMLGNIRCGGERPFAASSQIDHAALAYGYATPPKQLSEAEFFKLFPVAPHHKSNVFYAKWKGYGVAWSGGSKNKGWGKLSGPLVSFYDPYQEQWLETIFIDPDTLSPFPADKLSDPISYSLATEWLDTFRTWQPPPDEASSIRRFGGGHTFSRAASKRRVQGT